MIKLVNRLFFPFTTANPLARLLDPFSLNIQKSNTVPTLKLKSQKYLMENWWSQKPFQVQGSMTVPIFKFQTCQFAQKTVQLPQDIFNQPLRRDLIYRLYDFRINLNKFTTKKTRNRAMTSGSGKKMRAQKKGGVARMGDKRAPHLRKGGKAHGAKPKIFSFHLNSKIKLAALKALLTAKLVQGKIRIVDSELIDQAKTKNLAKILKQYQKDERALFCVITGNDFDPNFHLAQRGIKRLIHHNSYDLDVITLFKVDKILITQKGLQSLIQNLRKTQYVAFRQPHMPKLKPQAQVAKQQQQNWNPQKPYQFKFKILAEYMEMYDKIKKQNAQYLQKERQKIKPLTL